TRAGVARVAEIDVPPRVAVAVWPEGVVYVDTRAGLRAIRKRRCLFEDEIEASQARWVAERLPAKHWGKPEYRRCIEKCRRENKRLRWSRLLIPSDEVQEAVVKAVAEEGTVWVRFPAIADQLLPGDRTHSEAVRLNAVLARLHKAG